MGEATFKMTRSSFLRKQNAKYPVTLVEVPPSEWPDMGRCGLIRVWRSRRLLVQLFDPADGGQRFTVCRTEINPSGNWKDDISWDELQEAKNQAGFVDRRAIEIFPPSSELINVANMRHLWLIQAPPSFAWRKAKGI